MPRRLFATLMILASLLAPLSASAFDASDLQFNVDTTNGGTSQTCNVSVGRIMDMVSSNYWKNLTQQIIQQFSPQRLLPLIPQMLIAFISDYITSVSGGSAGNKSTTADTGGDTAAGQDTQYLDQIKSQFLTDCQSTQDIDQINSDFMRVFSENGRDGGPLWVEDWQAFIAQSRYRGQQIALNQMANTHYCPWLPMNSYFNIPDQAVNMVGSYADGTESYNPSADCTAPDNFDPYTLGSDPAASYATLMMPQNNIWGAYLLASENINRQVNYAAAADQNEYQSGIGSEHAKNPATGNGCLTMSPDGSSCLQYSTIINPSERIQSLLSASDKSLFDQANSGSKTANNARQRLGSLLLDATIPSLPFQFSPSAGINDLTTTTSGVATPAPTPTSGSTDPACANIPTGCTCIAGDPTYQTLADSLVQNAERTAISKHPELLTVDHISVAPGMNIAFMNAVCTEMGSACTVRAGSQNELAINVSGFTIAVDIITSTGVIRLPGQALAVCSAGTI